MWSRIKFIEDVKNILDLVDEKKLSHHEAIAAMRIARKVYEIDAKREEENEPS